MWRGNYVQPDVPQSAIDNDMTIRKIMGLLSKMTYEKFDILSDQLILLISNPTIMTRLGILIVEKACCEPAFSSMYASLCQKIRSQCSLELEENGKTRSFRGIVLNALQEQFENRNNFPDMIGLNSQDQEDLLSSRRRKVVGALRLICFLHKESSFISTNILHECIDELLSDVANSKDIDYIERVCYVISAVGKDIDTAQYKEKVDKYFRALREIAQDKAVSMRARFLIEDLIAKRDCNWKTKD